VVIRQRKQDNRVSRTQPFFEQAHETELSYIRGISDITTYDAACHILPNMENTSEIKIK